MKTYELLISVSTGQYVQVEAENEDEAYQKYFDGDISTEPYGEYNVESFIVDIEELKDD